MTTRGTFKLNIDNHHEKHKLTICILETHEGNTKESSLVNAKLKELMEAFINHLKRDDLKNWGLTLLMPCPNNARTPATQTLDNLKISYDTIELSHKHNHSDHNHAIKRIIFPAGNAEDKHL